MIYYSLDCQYQGPRMNLPDIETQAGREAMEANNLAWEHVEKALKALEIEHAHAYSFPDGSLYFYLRSNEEAEVIKTKLNQNLQSHNISVIPWEISSDGDPFKAGFKTVEEYLDAQENKQWMQCSKSTRPSSS